MNNCAPIVAWGGEERRGERMGVEGKGGDGTGREVTEG